ncbi:MAG: TetR/AcrR family transcriptional regulator, partial [Anaerolineae bacterium]
MVADNQAAGRQCILDQAQQLFFAHGYHGVSIRDIVQACGLSNAALYYHFGSKQNLYAEVIRGFVASVVQPVQEAEAGNGSSRERLTRMVLAFARFSSESQSELHVLLRDLTECEGEEIEQLIPELIGQILAPFATVLEDGISAGEIRSVDVQRISFLLLGMLNSLAARRLREPVAETLAEDVDLAIGTLYEGIG